MFKQRIRLPFYLSKAQFPLEKNVFRKADGSAKVLSATIRNTYIGQTDDLPEELHRKLVIALAHEEVTIEDNRLLTGVVIDGEYAIDWKDFLNHPTAQSKFTVQVTPFNATGNNCQSCEEITQVSLVDDYNAAIYNEGGSYEYPGIFDNDSICCFPFTAEIMSFNTLYFDSVTLTDGTLSIQVKASVPTINNVFIATYRVTCENGGYDEANVYGNIQGTSTECLPPSNLAVTFPGAEGEVYLQWDAAATIPAGGYDWALYLTSDLVTPVQSGNTSDLFVDLTGLTPGEDYTFVVNSNCGGSTSSNLTIEFNQPYIIPEYCGKFTIDFSAAAGAPVDYSFMDCSGVIINKTHTGFSLEIECMLINSGGTTPVFFSASNSGVTITYTDLC